MLETYVRAARLEGDVPGGIAAASISSLRPVTEYALRALEPSYRADALMAVEHFTHSAMTYVVRGQLSVDDVYPPARASRAPPGAAPGHGRAPAPVVGLGSRGTGVATRTAPVRFGQPVPST